MCDGCEIIIQHHHYHYCTLPKLIIINAIILRLVNYFYAIQCYDVTVEEATTIPPETTLLTEAETSTTEEITSTPEETSTTEEATSTTVTELATSEATTVETTNVTELVSNATDTSTAITEETTFVTEISTEVTQNETLTEEDASQGVSSTIAETTEETEQTTQPSSATNATIDSTVGNVTMEATETTNATTNASTTAATTVPYTQPTTTVPTTATSPTTTVSTTIPSTTTVTTTVPSTTTLTTSTVPSTTTVTTTVRSSTTTPLSSSTSRSTSSSTTASSPLTTTLLPTRPPDYVRYSVSSDSYFSDLTINATPSAGLPVDSVAGPFGFGAGVQLKADEENCLHRSNFYEGPKADCFNDLSNCSDTGVSVSIWVNIAFDKQDNNSRYIFSTGGDREGVPGLAIYYKGVDLHAVVSNGTHNWYVYALGPIANNTWSNIGLRWAEMNGYEMYVDQVRVAKVIQPTPASGSVKPALKPPEIAVGCHVAGDPLRFSNYSNGKFDEVVVWFHELNDTELPCFTGGFDPNSANMSVEDVATIITEKLNLTDLNQYSQAVDILNKMSENVEEVADDNSAEMVTTQEPPPLSEDNSNSSFFDNPNQGSYEVSEEVQTTSNNGKSTLEEKANKINTIANVIKQMTQPKNIKKNITIDEMDNMLDLLQTLSNTLDPNNRQAWLRIQQKSNSSFSFIEILNQWAIDIAKRTDTRKRSKSFQFTEVADNIVLTTQRLNVGEYNAQKGLTLPNYSDNKWQGVGWSDSSVKVPLDSTVLPRELFQKLRRDDSSSVFVSNVVFNSIDQLQPSDVTYGSLPTTNMIIDSKVMSLQIMPTQGLDYSLSFYPVRVTLKHKHQEPMLRRKLLFHDESRTIPTIKSRYCASWNPSLKPKGGWDSSGCEMYYTNDQYTICNCDHMGAYAILAQNIQRRMIFPDPDWLMYLKYSFYCLSAVTLILYIAIILISKNLKDQFHLIRLCTSVAALGGSACMFTTDFVRDDRHSCTAVTAVLHYSYVAVACWLLMESHALFGTMMHGIVGGKLKAYLPFAWGCPMLCLGIAIITGFQDYGLEPRCMVSWNDNLKWTLFAPNIIFGLCAIGLTAATILNTSFAAVKKEIVFEDVSSVAWGLLWVSICFVIDWIFACFAYLDIELMNPDFYPIFQVLNAGLGFLVFLFMGFGSKRFRMVLRGQKPDGRYLPGNNQKKSDLIPVKPQPKHIGPIQG